VAGGGDVPGTPNGVTVRGLRVLVVPDFQDRMEQSSALAVRVLVSELVFAWLGRDSCRLEVIDEAGAIVARRSIRASYATVGRVRHRFVAQVERMTDGEYATADWQGILDQA
jgi:hypothetical protein